MRPFRHLNIELLLVLALACGVGLARAADRVPLAGALVQGGAQGVSDGSLDGVVEAVRQTTLAAQVPGAVVALPVKAGDRVRAGQELLRIDARAAQQQVAGSAAQVEAAQASLKAAAAELERQKLLFQKQYISQAALDRVQEQWQVAQAQVQALQAQTRAAQTQSGFFILTAPYAGVIGEVAVTLGDMAMPGVALIRMHDPAALRVTAAVPQAQMAGISASLAGLRYVVPDSAGLSTPQTPLRAQLLPTLDPATHTAQLRLELPAGLQGLAPGMFARVLLPSAAQPAGGVSGQVQRLFVPLASVVRRAELDAVYVIDAQGQARLRQVRLGAVAGTRVEVLSGLRQGETVALDPQAAGRAR